MRLGEARHDVAQAADLGDGHHLGRDVHDVQPGAPQEREAREQQRRERAVVGDARHLLERAQEAEVAGPRL